MSPLKIIAGETGYTRNHVRTIAKKHKKRLGLRRRNKRWVMDKDQMAKLAALVRSESGPRRKLGETDN